MINLDSVLKYKISVSRDGEKKNISIYDVTDLEFESWFTHEYFLRLTGGEDWTASNRLLVRVLSCIDVGKVDSIFTKDLDIPTAETLYKAYSKICKSKSVKQED